MIHRMAGHPFCSQEDFAGLRRDLFRPCVVAIYFVRVDPAVALLASAMPAYADLKLCNRMSYVIEAAIGIDDKAATATRGWFRIDPAACRVVAQGTLTADRILLNARALGVYGSSPIPQNGADTLCIAPDNFVIAAARQCRAGQTPAPFTEIKPTPTDDGNLVAYLAEGQRI